MASPLNIRRLLHFAQLSKATYSKSVDTSSPVINRYQEIDEVRMPGDQTKALVLQTSDKVVIAFRGTANIRNAAEDIEFRKRKDKLLGIHLHKGFRTIAKDAYVKLPKLPKGRAVVLTGHSLGGAVAAIVSMYLLKEGHKVEGVYTFGQPKITCASGAAASKSLPLMRVVNDMDIVPLLPPDVICSCFNPYVHFGCEVYLSGKNASGYELSFGSDTRTSGKYKAAKRVVTNSVFEDVKDHFIDNYIKQLQKRVDADG